MKRFRIAGYNTFGFKTYADTRFIHSAITSHDNTSLEAVVVEDIDDVEAAAREKADVLAIDEVILGDDVSISSAFRYIIDEGNIDRSKGLQIWITKPILLKS